MSRLDRRILPVLLFLATGVLLGSALPELLGMGDGSYAGLSGIYSFRVYENSSSNPLDLFCYVASGRMRTLLLLWMSSFTSVGIIFHLGYAWWVISSGAMLLSLFGLRNGFQGIVLFGCCVLPQWILYAALWKREAVAWMRRNREQPVLTTGRIQKINGKDLQELVGLTVLCLVGCACEAFLGTWTLRLYLQL